jgi:hypothetical protein
VLLWEACFKGTFGIGQGCLCAQSSPAIQTPSHAKGPVMRGRRVRHHGLLPSISGAGCGTAAMAGDETVHIAVMDKVYAKVLTDGDFDFIGFMTARGLGPSEMLDLLEACAARLGAGLGLCARGFVRCHGGHVAAAAHPDLAGPGEPLLRRKGHARARSCLLYRAVRRIFSRSA